MRGRGGGCIRVTRSVQCVILSKKFFLQIEVEATLEDRIGFVYQFAYKKERNKKKVQGESFYGIKYVIRLKEHLGKEKEFICPDELNERRQTKN